MPTCLRTLSRLSRPSFAHQFPLSNTPDLGISSKASLAYPSDNANDKFIISPVLNLPEAFGSAYVGETFSCTLCANNELDPTDTTRAITGIKIQGDMQTPSMPTGSPLELAGPEDEDPSSPASQASPGPGESLQKILRFELKEEGNHVLAVTVTYTETALGGEGKAASGKVRTFRKLYQFVAQQLLSVRTKAGELGEKAGRERFLLEAQLENMGEAAVSFEVGFHISSFYPIFHNSTEECVFQKSTCNSFLLSTSAVVSSDGLSRWCSGNTWKRARRESRPRLFTSLISNTSGGPIIHLSRQPGIAWLPVPRSQSRPCAQEIVKAPESTPMIPKLFCS